MADGKQCFGRSRTTISTTTLQSLPEKCCRVCFDPETNENPILTPCDCRGSMKFIHEKCLKEWILSLMSTPTTFSCDVCKSPVKMEVNLKSSFSCKRLEKVKGKVLFCPFAIFVITVAIVLIILSIAEELEDVSYSMKTKIYLAVLAMGCFSIDMAFVVILFRAIKSACVQRTISTWKIFSKEENQAEITAFPEINTKSPVHSLSDLNDTQLFIRTHKTKALQTQRFSLHPFFEDSKVTPRFQGHN